MTIKKETKDDLIIYHNKKKRFTWRVRLNNFIDNKDSPKYANLKLMAGGKAHNLYLSRDALASLVETLMYALQDTK